jgi:hypothetical protein
MPGATRVRATIDGGPLKGGAPRVVWQTLGADPRIVSATSGAQRLNEMGRACHLVWNPFQGGLAQLIPILRAGRMLGRPEGLNQAPPPWPEPDARPVPRQPGTGPAAAGRPLPDGPARGASAGQVAEANAEGRLCVQICVVSFAWQPFTFWPMTGLQQILGWLDSWGIPRRWPAGPPAPFPDGLTTPGIPHRLWARGGYFAASQVPDLPAAGPGAIDVERLTGRGSGNGGRGPAGAVLPDLDGYFGGDQTTAAGTLSRVG